MIHGTMLLVSGVAMVLWRPCRSRKGRAPAAAVALLLVSAASVWAGSFALAVVVASGKLSGGLEACGIVWRQLLAGDLGWWRSTPLLLWTVVFPFAGLRSVVTRLRRSRALARDLAAVGRPLFSGEALTSVVSVPNLSTPAVTLGVIRQTVLVDRQFWEAASPTARDVVLAHEFAHVAGRHGLVDALATMLTAPITPLQAGRDVYECIRRHLEALADDAVARRHGRSVVGTTLGQVALSGFPVAGLGAAGACIWRVRRLVVPPSSSWRDRVLLVGMAIAMVTGFLLAGMEAAGALGAVTSPDFCAV